MARRPATIHGVLSIDKPLGWTSRDVVNKVGHLLADKRCGHAGTLDPDASGVLLVAFGEAGKAVRWLQEAAKTYEVDIAFGSATSSDDAAGEVVRTAPVPTLTLDALRAALPQPGWVDQIPPQVSALQTDGVRDHQRVRRGETIVRPARPVWLGDAVVLAVGDTWVRLRVTCGAGFYVRALARDLGESMQSAAHVTALRRVQSGGFDVADAVTIEALLALDPDDRRARVVPLVATLARVLPMITGDTATVLELRQGKTPAWQGDLPMRGDRPAGKDAADAPSFVVVLDEAGTAVCIARIEAETLHVERGFAWVSPRREQLPTDEPEPEPESASVSR